MNTLKSILLVEDDKDDQDFFIMAMNEIRNVALFDIVNNGKEALETLKKSTTLPSLIFMDIEMPLMSGLECLSEIAKSPRLSTIPVVMLSSSTNYTNQTLNLGAKAFIKKPDSIEVLRGELEKEICSCLYDEPEC